MQYSIQNVGVSMDDDGAWLELIRKHIHSHPEAEAVDLYKFLHQGVLGPGHMIANRESATGFLYKELADLPLSVPAGEGWEGLFEELDPRGDVLRVHLRPFLAAGGDPDSLAEAFVRSASAFDPKTGQDRLVQLWKRLIPELTGLLPDRANLESLDTELREAGYPMIRHSEAYRRAYSPAYRVVLRREMLLACPDGCCREHVRSRQLINRGFHQPPGDSTVRACRRGPPTAPDYP